MGLIQLSPRDCSHCFNLRAAARKRYVEQGEPEEWIKGALRDELCPEHQASRDEYERKERRRQRRG